MQRPTTAIVSLVSVVMFGLVGCSGWTIRTQESSTASLARYRTYAWLIPPKGSVEERLAGSPLDLSVRDALVEELRESGMVPARPGTQPDFLVTYRVSERERYEVLDYGLQQPFAYTFDYPYGYPYSYAYPGWGPITEVREYTEGTLVVELLDSRSGAVFWRGSATRAIDTPARSPDRGAEAVERIFREFPETYSARADHQHQHM